MLLLALFVLVIVGGMLVLVVEVRRDARRWTDRAASESDADAAERRNASCRR